ncbi:hypothetical protein PPERSA_12940 [Pseudocohnilembus persalinus]|uniref:Uncharacterized protein n=1 Tax=Pseudocohnilembus persalinus TaxID=266149 RepID=A0A0V0R1T1_PSEPJ|nr:hypothetical protein PPERSA_12940 [Pseudocohnilembus persalinus]|eukprot:KRX08459.1 hypothetical protein PPERSA_12940 [Pseudocohnilembus persalinus]
MSSKILLNQNSIQKMNIKNEVSSTDINYKNQKDNEYKNNLDEKQNQNQLQEQESDQFFQSLQNTDFNKKQSYFHEDKQIDNQQSQIEVKQEIFENLKLLNKYSYDNKMDPNSIDKNYIQQIQFIQESSKYAKVQTGTCDFEQAQILNNDELSQQEKSEKLDIQKGILTDEQRQSMREVEILLSKRADLMNINSQAYDKLSEAIQDLSSNFNILDDQTSKIDTIQYQRDMEYLINQSESSYAVKELSNQIKDQVMNNIKTRVTNFFQNFSQGSSFKLNKKEIETQTDETSEQLAEKIIDLEEKNEKFYKDAYNYQYILPKFCDLEKQVKNLEKTNAELKKDVRIQNQLKLKIENETKYHKLKSDQLALELKDIKLKYYELKQDQKTKQNLSQDNSSLLALKNSQQSTNQIQNSVQIELKNQDIQMTQKSQMEDVNQQVQNSQGNLEQLEKNQEQFLEQNSEKSTPFEENPDKKGEYSKNCEEKNQEKQEKQYDNLNLSLVKSQQVKQNESGFNLQQEEVGVIQENILNKNSIKKKKKSGDFHRANSNSSKKNKEAKNSQVQKQLQENINILKKQENDIIQNIDTLKKQLNDLQIKVDQKNRIFSPNNCKYQKEMINQLDFENKESKVNLSNIQENHLQDQINQINTLFDSFDSDSIASFSKQQKQQQQKEQIKKTEKPQKSPQKAEKYQAQEILDENEIQSTLSKNREKLKQTLEKQQELLNKSIQKIEESDNYDSSDSSYSDSSLDENESQSNKNKTINSKKSKKQSENISTGKKVNEEKIQQKIGNEKIIYNNSNISKNKQANTNQKNQFFNEQNNSKEIFSPVLEVRPRMKSVFTQKQPINKRINRNRSQSQKLDIKELKTLLEGDNLDKIMLNIQSQQYIIQNQTPLRKTQKQKEIELINERIKNHYKQLKFYQKQNISPDKFLPYSPQKQNQQDSKEKQKNQSPLLNQKAQAKIEQANQSLKRNQNPSQYARFASQEKKFESEKDNFNINSLQQSLKSEIDNQNSLKKMNSNVNLNKVFQTYELKDQKLFKNQQNLTDRPTINNQNSYLQNNNNFNNNCENKVEQNHKKQLKLRSISSNILAKKKLPEIFQKQNQAEQQQTQQKIHSDAKNHLQNNSSKKKQYLSMGKVSSFGNIPSFYQNSENLDNIQLKGEKIQNPSSFDSNLNKLLKIPAQNQLQIDQQTLSQYKQNICEQDSLQCNNNNEYQQNLNQIQNQSSDIFNKIKINEFNQMNGQYGHIQSQKQFLNKGHNLQNHNQIQSLENLEEESQESDNEANFKQNLNNKLNQNNLMDMQQDMQQNENFNQVQEQINNQQVKYPQDYFKKLYSSIKIQQKMNYKGSKYGTESQLKSNSQKQIQDLFLEKVGFDPDLISSSTNQNHKKNNIRMQQINQNAQVIQNSHNINQINNKNQDLYQNKKQQEDDNYSNQSSQNSDQLLQQTQQLKNYQQFINQSSSYQLLGGEINKNQKNEKKIYNQENQQQQLKLPQLEQNKQ